MVRPLPLSVLDLSPVGAGTAPSQAIRDSVALAKVADGLGFARYWFAEHHSMASIATSAPEVLIAHVAAVTERISVGAGGIMMPNHAPLHVVEQFRTLEALHPGRIDLGLGRAPGTDPLTASALQRANRPDPDRLLAELFAFEAAGEAPGEGAGFPERHPYRGITPMPSDVRLPSVWMLGSTFGGASIGAQLGLPYAFAGHFSMKHARASLAHYRRDFRPSARWSAPHAMLAVTVICGRDDAEADQLAAPMRVAIARNLTGKREPIRDVETALRYEFSDAERAIVDEFFTGAVIGGPARVGDELRRLAAELEVQELMCSTLVADVATRRASLERTIAAMA
ncbi:MAG: LLM class flavin-dependent oxidoreductase [Proteobacteria bacterium]|nr:LLM class flavin-dependent oxidoreductase [Pseudomonadota bacterium]